MKLKVRDTKGKEQGELEVKFELVEGGKGTQAVHDAVVAYNAAQRMGTASTKTMGEVAGTGKKPWRQKGTGRARAGSFASPLWRGGGVVFGPKPRDFGKKVSRKTKQLALRKALTERLKAGDVIVKIAQDRVSNSSDWRRLMRGQKAGPIAVTILRDRREQTISIKLPERRSSDAATFQFDFPDVPAYDAAELGKIMKELQPQIERAQKSAMITMKTVNAKTQREMARNIERSMRQLERELEREQKELSKDEEKE